MDLRGASKLSESMYDLEILGASDTQPSLVYETSQEPFDIWNSCFKTRSPDHPSLADSRQEVPPRENA